MSMHLLKNGLKTGKDFVRIARHNQPLEFGILAGAIAAYLLKNRITPVDTFFDRILPAFYNSDKINLIVNASAIMLGIYITVITIIATSELGVTKSMIEKGRHEDLLQIVLSGMSINILLVFLCVLDGAASILGAACISVLFVLSAVSFVNFMRLIRLIFFANLTYMKDDINERKQTKENVLTLLNKIEKKLN